MKLVEVAGATIFTSVVQNTSHWEFGGLDKGKKLRILLLSATWKWSTIAASPSDDFLCVLQNVNNAPN